MILQHSGVPIYLQVKNLIMSKIKNGDYRPGDKVPTEREFALRLGISRNTVSTAYKELLLEGILEACQGRGTFVRVHQDEDAEIIGGRRERALRIIDEAMAKVVELGFTVDQFATIAAIRAKEKAETLREIRVAVVDCTREFVSHFIMQLTHTANVRFEPLLLGDLRCGAVSPDFLRASDLVITTAEHYAEVSKFAGGDEKVLAVSVLPSLEAVVRLARLPADAQIGMVAETPEFVETFKRLLSRTGINGVKINVHTSSDKEEIRRFASVHSILVVSEGRETLVRYAAPETADIIKFYFEIDQGSLHQVLARIVSIKE